MSLDPGESDNSFFEFVLVGKSVSSLVTAGTLSKLGITSCLILDISPKSKRNVQNVLLDFRRHSLCRSCLPLEESELRNHSNVIRRSTDFSLFPIASSIFLGCRLWSGYRTWETLDYNDVYLKIEHLVNSLPNCENFLQLQLSNLEWKLDYISVQDFLDQNSYFKSTRKIYATLVSTFMGTGIEYLSLLWFLWCLKCSGGVSSLVNSSQNLIEISRIEQKLTEKLEDVIKVEQVQDIRFVREDASSKQENTVLSINHGAKFIQAKYVMNFVPLLVDVNRKADFFTISKFLKPEPVLSIGAPIVTRHNFEQSSNVLIDYFKQGNFQRFFASKLRVAATIYGIDAIRIHLDSEFNATSVGKTISFPENLRKNAYQMEFNLAFSQCFNFPKQVLTSLFVEDDMCEEQSNIFSIDPLRMSFFPASIEGQLHLSLSILKKILPQYRTNHLLRLPFYQHQNSALLKDDSILKISTHWRMNIKNIFDSLPSIRTCCIVTAVYLGYCVYKFFEEEAYEVVAVLYLYYQFDSARDRWFQPKPNTTRFQKFLKFFQLQQLQQRSIWGRKEDPLPVEDSEKPTEDYEPKDFD